MPTMDQCVWASVNLTSGGEPRFYKRGDLLPEPVTADESAARSLLRIGGATRVVEVVYTPEELAAQAAAQAGALGGLRAEAPPAAAPPTDQAPGGTAAAAAPVVVGDEDLRAEHEQARGRRGPGGKFTKPAAPEPDPGP